MIAISIGYMLHDIRGRGCGTPGTKNYLVSCGIDNALYLYR